MRKYSEAHWIKILGGGLNGYWGLDWVSLAGTHFHRQDMMFTANKRSTGINRNKKEEGSHAKECISV